MINKSVGKKNIVVKVVKGMMIVEIILIIVMLISYVINCLKGMFL